VSPTASLAVSPTLRLPHCVSLTVCLPRGGSQNAKIQSLKSLPGGGSEPAVDAFATTTTSTSVPAVALDAALKQLRAQLAASRAEVCPPIGRAWRAVDRRGTNSSERSWPPPAPRCAPRLEEPGEQWKGLLGSFFVVPAWALPVLVSERLYRPVFGP
jgi:hypothetical protein